MELDVVGDLKKSLFEEYDDYFYFLNLSKEIRQVFIDVDRHKFVDKFRVSSRGSWIKLTPKNYHEYLPIIYRDEYLIIQSTPTDDVISSLSQPTLVLYMLALANIEKGYDVLEIGTASGWNAAMLSKLVGENGTVTTIEIDKKLSASAEKRLKEMGFNNIDVQYGDGGRGVSQKTFDVVMYTVGTYDIPDEIYKQVKTGGLLILVLKNHGGGDTLVKFRRYEDGFTSESAIPCGFVQIQGEMQAKEMQPRIIKKDKHLAEIWNHSKTSKNFWFGGMNERQFHWRTLPFRAYLSIVEPYYCVITDSNESVEPGNSKIGFGIYNPDEFSIAIFHHEMLVCSGKAWAEVRIMERLEEWVRNGMPTLASFKIKAMRKTKTRLPDNGEYLLRRDESDFFFSPCTQDS